MYATNCIYKYRETVSGIFHTLLVAEPTERLAWWSSYYYTDIVTLWIVKAYFQKLIVAFSIKICVICINSLLYHFKSYGFKAYSFKTQG